MNRLNLLQLNLVRDAEEIPGIEYSTSVNGEYYIPNIGKKGFYKLNGLKKLPVIYT